MASKFETFKALHAANRLFVLPNAWNAGSALIFQQNNYPAVGTSSAAVAASLGYADGEGMPFDKYLMIIRRVTASVSIPVTVDMEMGYGKTAKEVYANILRLLDAGVVGINIEDSVVTEGTRTLKDAGSLAVIVKFVKDELGKAKQSLFINVRCDTYILNVPDKQNETTRRLKAFEEAGADGIFLPCISEEKDIAKAVSNTRLPLNVMAIPGLPGMEKLDALGVKRVSMGPFLHNKTYERVKELAKEVKEQNSLQSIF